MTTASRARDYVVINGQGRSGTNWLLELLDASPRTHCRNEPNELEGTALYPLTASPVAAEDQRALLESDWDEAVATASRRVGDRDHRAKIAKHHLNELARRSGVYRLAHSGRLRRAIAGDGYALEWPLPRYVSNAARLRTAIVVLKMNGGPGWTSWLLANRPSVAFLHIARHPGGFLNSWYNRWLSRNDPAAVSSANQARLGVIAKHDSRFADTIGDIASMSVEESELWYWRYNIETTYEAGHDCEQYRLILFESLAAEPLEVAQGFFAHCGLEWTDDVARLVSERTSSSDAIAKKWREKLEPRQVEIVERVLDGSAMQDWWS